MFCLSEYSAENEVYYNNIGWNSWKNPKDNEISNIWDNGVDLVNFRGDYDGEGNYSTLGGAESVDRYPQLIGSTFTPRIKSPTETTTTDHKGPLTIDPLIVVAVVA